MCSQTTRNQHSSAEPPPPSSGATASDPARIASLELELVQMRDQWAISAAETANVCGWSKRDIGDARQFAIQNLATDIIEMADNLRRGIASLPAPSKQEPEIVTRLREGFSGIEHSFAGLLGRNGITRHDRTGTAFDPGLRQAMAEQASAEHKTGTVLQAWTSGWTLNGRLLRPAMVVTSTAWQ